MIKNKKRLANILGAAMVIILLWAVFAMFGQGLSPLPSSGKFNLVTWAQQKVQAAEVLSAQEAHSVYEEGEGVVGHEEDVPEAYEGHAENEAYEGDHEEAHEGVEEHEAYEGHEKEDYD